MLGGREGSCVGSRGVAPISPRGALEVWGASGAESAKLWSVQSVLKAGRCLLFR